MTKDEITTILVLELVVVSDGSTVKIGNLAKVRKQS